MAQYQVTRRAPKTKEQLLDRILSHDFTGNVKDLAPNTVVQRVRKNSVALTFPDTGATYLLTIHKPKAAMAAVARKLVVGAEIAAGTEAPDSGGRTRVARRRGRQPPRRAEVH